VLEAAVTGSNRRSLTLAFSNEASGAGSLIACRGFPRLRAERLALEDLDISTRLQDFKGDIIILMTVH
jgi:hypothetical protein